MKKPFDLGISCPRMLWIEDLNRKSRRNSSKATLTILNPKNLLLGYSIYLYIYISYLYLYLYIYISYIYTLYILCFLVCWFVLLFAKTFGAIFQHPMRTGAAEGGEEPRGRGVGEVAGDLPTAASLGGGGEKRSGGGFYWLKKIEK